MEKTKLEEAKEELNQIWDIVNIMALTAEAMSGKTKGGLCEISDRIVDHIGRVKDNLVKLKDGNDEFEYLKTHIDPEELEALISDYVVCPESELTEDAIKNLRKPMLKLLKPVIQQAKQHGIDECIKIVKEYQDNHMVMTPVAKENYTHETVYLKGSKMFDLIYKLEDLKK